MMDITLLRGLPGAYHICHILGMLYEEEWVLHTQNISPYVLAFLHGENALNFFWHLKGDYEGLPWLFLYL
jgi:hypothetical protein